VTTLTHEFVEFIPDELKEERLYISVQYATVAHKCCCGCGKEVVTPLSPTDWKLVFDGKTVSLDPSIGNWSFQCRSHYWIRNNRVKWAAQWTQKQIDRGRAHDRFTKEKYFDTTAGTKHTASQDYAGESEVDKPLRKVWHALKKLWS